MSKADVLRIIGPPSEACYGDEMNPSYWTWCYGVDKPGSAATLGMIAFDAKGKVRYWTQANDAEYPPPPPNVITETELRHLIQVVHSYYLRSRRTGGAVTYDFNPLPLIQAVNTLHPYGKKKVLLAIQEYLWTNHDSDEIKVLLLALFDIPVEKGYLPQFDFQGFDRPVGRSVPRFPLVIIDDVPIIVFYFTNSQGIRQWREPILGWFKSRGNWRSKPLTPTSNPLGVLEKFMASSEYIYLHSSRTSTSGLPKVPESTEKQVQYDVQRQLLRMIDNVYPYNIKYDFGGRDPLRRLPKEDWQRMCLEFSKVDAEWDVFRQDYVRSR